MSTTERSRVAPEGNGDPCKSRLAYHLRCLGEDATDPGMGSMERLALVRERVGRVREIRRLLAASVEATERASRSRA
jgi:hypothetical protein